MLQTLNSGGTAEIAEWDTVFEQQLIALMPSLRSFAKQFYRDSSDIDDLVQDVVVKALRFSHQYQEGTSMKSWLYKIMRNTFYTEYRRRQKSCVSFQDTPPEQMIAPSQLLNLQRKELLVALDKLAPPRRDVIVLIIEGISYEEAAKHLGCQIGTVKSRVNRARKDLIEALGMAM